MCGPMPARPGGGEVSRKWWIVLLSPSSVCLNSGHFHEQPQELLPVTGHTGLRSLWKVCPHGGLFSALPGTDSPLVSESHPRTPSAFSPAVPLPMPPMPPMSQRVCFSAQPGAGARGVSVPSPECMSGELCPEALAPPSSEPRRPHGSHWRGHWWGARGWSQSLESESSRRRWGGPSETPHFIEEELGPERGGNLLLVIQQGQAEPRPQASSPDVLPRTFPNMPPTPQGTWQDGPRSPEDPGLLQMDLTRPRLPIARTQTPSASRPLCFPKFPET